MDTTVSPRKQGTQAQCYWGLEVGVASNCIRQLKQSILTFWKRISECLTKFLEFFDGEIQHGRSPFRFELVTEILPEISGVG